jgi:hypothetical protein
LGWDLFPNPIGGFPVGGTTRWEPNPWEPKTQPTRPLLTDRETVSPPRGSTVFATSH